MICSRSFFEPMPSTRRSAALKMLTNPSWHLSEGRLSIHVFSVRSVIRLCGGTVSSPNWLEDFIERQRGPLDLPSPAFFRRRARAR